VKMNTKETIIHKLTLAFTPEHLEVINESHMHNVPEGSQSHFKIILVTDEFKDKPLLARHRMINKLLEPELSGAVHALALHTMTSDEWLSKGVVPDSPQCRGGDGISR